MRLRWIRRAWSRIVDGPAPRGVTAPEPTLEQRITGEAARVAIAAENRANTAVEHPDWEPRLPLRPHMGREHPPDGLTELLVYGECPCNPTMPWRCACPEGARWPRCPLCGERVKPPAPEPFKYKTAAELRAWRQANGRRGYVATLMDEGDALTGVRALNGPTSYPGGTLLKVGPVDAAGTILEVVAQRPESKEADPCRT